MGGVTRVDAIVVGAGIVGLATARRLLLERPGLRVVVTEKEREPGLHQTGHNSGVVHSGIYYAPGSLKARLCLEGKALLEAFADEKGIDRVERGKVVVALDESELGRLDELERRGNANGVPGLRRLRGEELRELEPNVNGVAALLVPHTGVIDYRQVTRALADDVRALGGEVRTSYEVRSVSDDGAVVSADESLQARVVLACAGLQGDRLARSTTRIVPFRGDYYTLRGSAAALVERLVYPVPDPTFPFLGVHLTKGVDGTMLAGPNAVLSLAREGYGRTSLSLRDAATTLSSPAFWRFARRHVRTGAAEAWRDVSKRAFIRDLQRYVPAVEERDATFGPSGIRAQAILRDGKLADDFVLERSGRAIHVVSAPSPAATSSLAIAGHLTRYALDAL